MKQPWKTMETNQEHWTTVKQPWKSMKTKQKPWTTARASSLFRSSSSPWQYHQYYQLIMWWGLLSLLLGRQHTVGKTSKSSQNQMSQFSGTMQRQDWQFKTSLNTLSLGIGQLVITLGLGLWVLDIIWSKSYDTPWSFTTRRELCRCHMNITKNDKMWLSIG